VLNFTVFKKTNNTKYAEIFLAKKKRGRNNKIIHAQIWLLQLIDTIITKETKIAKLHKKNTLYKWNSTGK